MNTSVRAGLFVYAHGFERLRDFYAAVLGLPVVHDTGELAVLRAPAMDLLVHRIPAHIAATFEIAVPPVLREAQALKFFFPVDDLAAAGARAAAHGGGALSETWRGPGFVVCNAFDPEGNIFQLRAAAD